MRVLWRTLGFVISGLMIVVLMYPGIAQAQPTAETPLGWSQPENISQSTADSTSPAAALVNGRLHVIWEEGDQLYHRYQTDSGWSTASAIGTGSEPAVAADGNKLHLVYVAVFGGNAEILYRSWDATKGWSSAINVSRTTAASATPSIAISGNSRRHVVWVDNALTDPMIFYAESTDGLVWESGPIADAFGTGPQVVTDATGRPHVLWVGPYSFDDPLEVFYCWWTGSEWTWPEYVSNTPNADSTRGSLVLDPKGTPWATWQEKVSGRWQVWTASRLTTGWGKPSTMAQTGIDLSEPTLAVGDRLAQAWVSNGTLQMRWFDDQWSPPETVWQDSNGINQPTLVVGTNGEAWAVWSSPDKTGAGDIFVSHGKAVAFRLYLPLQIRQAP
ncbi:MAG: hypothetical protein GXP39_06080 [Chloroflexi bacterium]|nr:hypothetical protein [Chloroflexota bacterium]